MAIVSLDNLLAAALDRVGYQKTTSRTSVAAIPFSVFDIAGSPGAGTLAIGNTANGIMPTDAVAGYPPIATFAGGATGRLSKVEFGNTVSSRLTLFDTLFSAGAYSFNSNVSLASQPSIASRVPDADYDGLELWLECVTAFTGNQSIAVTYTNQAGAAAHTTGVIATGIAPIVGRMLRLPLAAGDSGLQKIESVVSSVATVGTFNVHILRRLWSGRVRAANDGDTHDILKTGGVRVFDDSALRLVVTADGTATGLPEINFDIASA